MNKLSIGKIRGLQQITTDSDIFVMCAMDHRGSLQKMISKEHPEKVGYEEMIEHKLELCAALAPHASAVLLDPVFGAAQCIAGNVLPRDTGLLVSLEATGYSGTKEKRVTKPLENWDAQKIRKMGGSAAKLLVYYRPDLEDLAQRQLNTITQLAEGCAKIDIAFLVEPVSYPIDGETGNPQLFAAKKPNLVIETARQVTALPIDVLKAEFPADPEYEKDEGKLLELCRQLDSASRVPWVVLSAGVDYDTFCRQVEIACRAGASGFLGGRAVWQEAMSISDAKERRHYLSTTAADRLKRLAEIAAKYAVPWYKKLGISAAKLTELPQEWYEIY